MARDHVNAPQHAGLCHVSRLWLSSLKISHLGCRRSKWSMRCSDVRPIVQTSNELLKMLTSTDTHRAGTRMTAAAALAAGATAAAAAAALAAASAAAASRAPAAMCCRGEIARIWMPRTPAGAAAASTSASWTCYPAAAAAGDRLGFSLWLHAPISTANSELSEAC